MHLIKLMIIFLMLMSQHVFANEYVRLIPPKASPPGQSTPVPNFGSLFQTFLNNINQAAHIDCAIQLDKELYKRISQERMKLKNDTKIYLVITNWTACDVMLTEYRGSNDVLSKEGEEIDIYTLELMPFLPSESFPSNRCDSDFYVKISKTDRDLPELVVTPNNDAPCGISLETVRNWKQWGIRICYITNGKQKVARQDMTPEIKKEGKYTYRLAYSDSVSVTNVQTSFFNATLPSSTYPEKRCSI